MKESSNELAHNARIDIARFEKSTMNAMML